jgi:hypothetical protein
LEKFNFFGEVQLLWRSSTSLDSGKVQLLNELYCHALSNGYPALAPFARRDIMDGKQTFGGNVTARQELVQAIAALESQRSLLGDPVVETALWALRQRLTALPAPVPRRNGHQQQQLTVLVADLSGFTAMAERLDAEQVRDVMNLVWSELDGVIEAWGGRVDQHAGDSMAAHFGLPHPRTDDPAARRGSGAGNAHGAGAA